MALIYAQAGLFVLPHTAVMTSTQHYAKPLVEIRSPEIFAHILPISAFQVVRITGWSQLYPAKIFFFFGSTDFDSVLC
jgi:hypothetical protein